MFIFFPDMNSPIFPTLDDIYCKRINAAAQKDALLKMGVGCYGNTFPYFPAKISIF